MRQTFNISLPEDMSRFVRRRVKEFDFATVSEYFRHLIRLDVGGLIGRDRYGHDQSPIRRFSSDRDPVTGRWR